MELTPKVCLVVIIFLFHKRKDVMWLVFVYCWRLSWRMVIKFLNTKSISVCFAWYISVVCWPSPGRKESGQDNLTMFFLNLIASQFIQLYTHRQETLLYSLFVFWLFTYVCNKTSENVTATMTKCIQRGLYSEQSHTTATRIGIYRHIPNAMYSLWNCSWWWTNIVRNM